MSFFKLLVRIIFLLIIAIAAIILLERAENKRFSIKNTMSTPDGARIYRLEKNGEALFLFETSERKEMYSLQKVLYLRGDKAVEVLRGSVPESEWKKWEDFYYGMLDFLQQKDVELVLPKELEIDTSR